MSKKSAGVAEAQGEGEDEDEETEAKNVNLSAPPGDQPEREDVCASIGRILDDFSAADDKAALPGRQPKPRRPVSYPWGPESNLEPLDRLQDRGSFVPASHSDPTRLGKCGGEGAVTAGAGSGGVLGGGGKVKLQVKPFTKESLERLERKTVQLVKEYGFQPRRKLSVEDGSRLPAKYEPFPSRLYGRPLEEIDNFIYDETFCVVSKRFRKNYIHRFTATSSVFLFSPWSPTRRACIYLSTNQYFDYVVMATILLNCVFLAMTETIEEAEYIFLAIYTVEMVVKSIAKGFILNKYTYLRNPWNWLDFVVITSGYATIGMDMGNLAGLRTFRVLRALKTISILPGLKTIINALLHSFKQLAEVMTLTIFCLMVFALFALQVYKGELRNKCVLKMDDRNATYEAWYNWTTNPENWMYKEEDDDPLLCGNVTGARHCPPTHTCLCVGENPNHGYTSFDNFLWSMLTTFQLITLDYWENVYNMVLSSCGPISVSFFTVVVFFGSFYLINLMLAVVALSYEEEAEITQEERKKELVDHREDSTFSFDPSNLNVKKLSKHKIKKIDARKGVLLSSYTRKRTRRRKRTRSGIASNSSPSHHHRDTGGGAMLSGGGSIASVSSSGGGNNHQQQQQQSSQNKSQSATPSPSPSPRNSRSSPRPQVLPLPPPKHVQLAINTTSNTLVPMRLGSQSRQTSSNSEGNNRESSLDDSGVVDDHEDADVTSEDVAPVSVAPTTAIVPTSLIRKVEVTPVTVTVTDKEVKLTTKCNGVGSCKKNKKKKNKNKQLHDVYTLPPDYLSHIVVIDDIPDRNCRGCEQCCMDYTGWLQFQQALYRIVRDPLFELAITICIVLNTMFLAMEHHGMSESVLRALDIGNKVFTSIFTFECCMKLMALSKEFFQCGWNIFDLIIVSASLLDLIFELVDGLSVLRGLRLLRVLKLAQSWITMKVLLSIIISSIGALGNLTFVLVIVIYIFAVIGMQLFAKDYTPERFYPDPVPRWNFTDFFHSFMMIFRILCGEWIEPLWDCMRAESIEGPGTCLAIFLPTLVMGNFMVLNLFLALLLNSFNSEELKTRKEEVGDESKLAQSFERIRDIVRKKRQQRLREQRQNENNSRLEQIVREVMQRHAEEEAFSKGVSTKAVAQTKIYNRSYQEALNRPISIISYDPPEYHETLRENEILDTSQIKRYSTLINGGGQDDVIEKVPLVVTSHPKLENKLLLQNMSSGLGTTGDSKEDVELHQLSLAASVDTEHDEESALCPEKTPRVLRPQPEAVSQEESGNRPWQTLVSYVDELTLGGRKNSKGQFVDGDMGSFPGFGRNKKAREPPECFPQHCYDQCSCWDRCLETKLGGRWTDLRRAVLSVVDTPAFEWFILVLIFASSVTLCFEDIHLDENPRLKIILYWTNLAFSVIFIVEMVLKWLALGFHKYFTSFWTLLDFLIVFVSVFSLLIEENENLRVLRSLRTLRALRPLRAISRWQGMRIVVNALMYAIPSIFNVLLVCLVFWLIFSIMGVQFFSGKFYKCLDEAGELLPTEVVDDMWECLENNYTWMNSKISFDHVGVAYLALFQVATFEGWMEVMADAVDARGVHLQPQREANLYAYIYFVIFIVCGSFFTLNLFIGVIIDNFNMLKKKYEGGVLEMFLTESQKHYYTAMKKLGRKKPQKVIKRPMNQFLAMFYDLSNSRRFEIAIFVLIFLNMLTMGIEHYNQPHAVFFLLEVSNAFFTTVFGLEAIVKIIGLRYHYFTVPWNVFDFLLVLASILGILMEDIMIDFPVSPTLLRVVRVFRIGRILRLIKAAKGIRKLLFALVVSLPALFNIGALLALITFIYAIIGMFLFGHVRQQGALDDMVNFQTFGRSMHLLFRLITSAGWNDVLESLMVEPPECDPSYRGQSNGDCGYPLLAIIYFTSFIIINYMIVINMYIAIILENFNQAHQEEEIGIVEDDLEMFYIRWSKYDPHASQFIRFSQLSDFIASLDPPLGISKPNTVALVSFNLPIAKGNRIHCLDILHALVKHVLGHVEETDNFRQLQEQMDIKFKKQFPTRKELEIVSSTRMWKRQDKAARLIQKTYRDYVRRRKEKEREALECEDETTQTSSPGGWQGRLSAFLHVHRGSRASSRKSSRASDASDLSELGGPWLNLPLLLLSGAANMDPEELDLTRESADGPNNQSLIIKQSAPATASASEQSSSAPPPPRRRSIYNFLLRHQDAVETQDEDTSKGNVAPAPLSSLHPAAAEDVSKPKRGSVIRRKHPTRSSIKVFKQHPHQQPPLLPLLSDRCSSAADVSILVTEASPESPAPVPTPPGNRRSSSASSLQRPSPRPSPPSYSSSEPPTVVQVLVHRESEEYNQDDDPQQPTDEDFRYPITNSGLHLESTMTQAEPNLMESGTYQAASGSNPPESRMHQSESRSNQPESRIKAHQESGAGINQPDLQSEIPRSGIHQPETGITLAPRMHQTESRTNQPASGMQPAASRINQPEARINHPESELYQPDTYSSEFGTNLASRMEQTASGTNQPASGMHQSGSKSNQSETNESGGIYPREPQRNPVASRVDLTASSIDLAASRTDQTEPRTKQLASGIHQIVSGMCSSSESAMNSTSRIIPAASRMDPNESRRSQSAQQSEQSRTNRPDSELYQSVVPVSGIRMESRTSGLHQITSGLYQPELRTNQNQPDSGRVSRINQTESGTFPSESRMNQSESRALKPTIEANQSESGTPYPELHSESRKCQPILETDQLEFRTKQPELESSPVSKWKQPDLKTTQTDSKSNVSSDSKLNQPVSKISQLVSKLNQSVSKLNQPVLKLNQPVSKMNQPTTRPNQATSKIPKLDSKTNQSPSKMHKSSHSDSKESRANQTESSETPEAAAESDDS